VSHEMILEMTYLDQFISEAARIQPIVPRFISISKTVIQI